MSGTRTRDLRSVLAVAATASAWCVATLAFVITRSLIDGLHFTGTYAGLFAGDQLRYLAWIRDAGLHGLIADPFRAAASHLYLHPVFLISGLLWRAGLSIQAAYLVWTPVALATLIGGYTVFTRHVLSGRERAAALALSILYLSPLVPLMDYGRIVDARGVNELIVVAGHGAAYEQAWGFLPTVIALGLMPVFVLGLASDDPSPRRIVGMAVTGALVAWLHPWGGVELVLIAVGRLAPTRRSPAPKTRLVICAAVAALPLSYYAVLVAADPGWSLSQLRRGTSGPVWPLLFDFGPLLVVGLPAIRYRPRDALGQLVLLWLGAVAVTYIAFPNSRDAALEGASLPLAVLAVQGWRRWLLPSRVSWLALALAIVPGAFYAAHTFHDLYYSRAYPFSISAGEQRAVDALARDPLRRGTVLATQYLAGALPALTGLLNGQVESASNAQFDGRVAISRLIERQRATVVVSDCLPGRADLSSELARLGFVERREWCERNWVLIGTLRRAVSPGFGPFDAVACATDRSLATTRCQPTGTQPRHADS